jgi:NAD(P)-dependent dehydrogenase (short-subunit alcohol dehydrogenase family)
MSVDLKGKTCVVTGSARSIGLAIAKMYVELGANVAMMDINEEVVREAEKLNGGTIVKGYVADITDQAAVMDVFDKIASEVGPVYALVNNAGFVDQQPIDEAEEANIDRCMKINVNGTIYASQGALKTMKTLGNGRIINFSSKSGKTGSALMGAYSAAKGAIIALTHTLAFEYAKDNIKCNCLCPGIVDMTGVWESVSKGYIREMNMNRDEIIDKFTAKIPLGRLAAVEDIVAYVKFLTIDGDYCTGQALNISGGREMH